jgi:hypothetical protein
MIQQEHQSMKLNIIFVKFIWRELVLANPASWIYISVILFFHLTYYKSNLI